MRNAILLLLVTLLGMSAGTHAAPDANDLMARNFEVSKISGFDGKVSMVLVNERGQERVRKVLVWSRLKDTGPDSEVLMRFEEPADIKGTGFLQIENSAADDDIWVYLPALGKTRRLVSSNKRDSFFGTDFSYGDVLPPPVNQYEHRYLRNEALDGTDCYVVESTPIDDKTRSDSGYSRKVSWLDIASLLERKVEYYDLAGKLLKTQTTYDPKLIEPAKNRWLPMRRDMVNAQNGHKTIYRFDEVTLNPTLTKRFFSTRSLER